MHCIDTCQYGKVTVGEKLWGLDLNNTWPGDGLGAPPSVAPLQRLTTSEIGDADVLVGDFSQLLVGFRTQAHIEVTREAASAFEKHQVLIKITLRFDSNLARGGAFHRLTGITT